MKWAVAAFVVCLAGFPASQVLNAQSPPAAALPGDGQVSGQLGVGPAPRPVGTTFRSTTELVALNVTVTDPKERFVTGLTKDNFAVFEEGVRQDVTFFAATDVPLDVSLLVDTSASMTDKIDLVRQAALRFVRALRSGDRAEVLGFSNDTQVLVPFTDDHARLEAAIRATTPRGSTALYNSMYVAIQNLSRLAASHADVRRPALIVLTDGDDTSSVVTYDHLLDAAKRANVAVYTISIVSKTDAERMAADGSKRYSTQADFALKSLSRETGGRSFFPLQLQDLNGVYGQIAEELALQYAIGYSPNGHGDGSFRRVFVKVLNHEGATPRTRSGYYAAKTVRASLETR